MTDKTLTREQIEYYREHLTETHTETDCVELSILCDMALRSLTPTVAEGLRMGVEICDDIRSQEVTSKHVSAQECRVARAAIEKCVAALTRAAEAEESVAHTDHPLRHWDRTCQACNPATDPAPVDREAVAWIKEWADDGAVRRRVDLYKNCEAWLHDLNPTIIPLYASSPPAGSVVVPVEPTEAMIRAGKFAAAKTSSVVDVWNAMLTAAKESAK